MWIMQISNQCPSKTEPSQRDRRQGKIMSMVSHDDS